MYILDFDKASSFTPTKEDVKTKLVPAFLGNDPYFSRPDGPEKLWMHFREMFLKASAIICRQGGLGMQKGVWAEMVGFVALEGVGGRSTGAFYGCGGRASGQA